MPERLARALRTALGAALVAALPLATAADGGTSGADSQAQRVAAEGPGLGVAAPAQTIAAWDISIAPDGSGLPQGSGSARQGAGIFAAKCRACHGEAGAGTPNDALVGGRGTLASPAPVRTVGSYWPYATTLFDYIRRAMPLNQPQSLTADELYAVTAYVLSLNGIVDEKATLDGRSLPRVVMPNRAAFSPAWPMEPPARP